MISKNKEAPPSGGKKNLISLLEYSEEEIGNVISMARVLKGARFSDRYKILNGKTGVLIFEKPSLRTHISFETALHELGGHSVVLSANMVQMGKRETVKDVAKNLERMVHLIVARTYSHQTIIELAMHSSIPVINALSDKFHPCQALAFGVTMNERFGGQKGLKVVFIGDGNNVCQSLMILCAKLGYHFVAACPKGYEPDRSILETCESIAKRNNASIAVVSDPASGVKDASVLYTDVWTSMGQEDEAMERKKRFVGFQVNEALVKKAPADVLVSHCLPAHREEEITSDVLDSDRSIALDEAENRLHAQKAVILHLFS
jgi:ornithine carbamoyltransferase